MANPKAPPSVAYEIPRPGRIERVAIAAVLGLALGLRLWGAFNGLPDVYNVDEQFEVNRAVRLGMGGFDFERWSKGGYYLILFLEYGIYFAVSFVTGRISGVAGFAAEFVSDPSAFWAIGRTTTALLGTGTVALLWWHGRRIGGPWAGIAAALFLAFSAQHVRDSHFITVDAAMTFFAFWAVVLVVEDAAGRRRLNPYLFAAVAAFAVACKVPAALVFLPYLFGRWLGGGLRGADGLVSLRTGITLGLAGLAYLAFNPAILWQGEAVFRFVATTFAGGGEVVATQYAGAGAAQNLWAFYGANLLDSQGIGILLLAALGVGVAAQRRDLAGLLHLAFAGPLFVAIATASTENLFYARYLTPLLPAVSLYAGLAVAPFVLRLRVAPKRAVAAGLALVLVPVLEPAVASVALVGALGRPHTASAATDWIEAHIPGGRTILLKGNEESRQSLSVSLQNTKANIRRMVARLDTTDPGKADYWRTMLRVHEEPAYDLVAVPHFAPWDTFASYRARGVSYVVIETERFAPGAEVHYARYPPGVIESRRAFYDALARSPSARLAASFDPAREPYQGRAIEIWSLGPAPDSEAPAAGPIPHESERLNFLVIMADDLGWNDVGYHGSEIATPNIDALARAGLVLDGFYVFANCVQTRAAFETGLNPARLGIRSLEHNYAGGTAALPEEAETVADRLSDLGYRTALVGKWHLSKNFDEGPLRNGYDYAFGYLSGQIDHYGHRSGGGEEALFRNDAFIEEEGHVTDLIAEEAVAVIARTDERPFFLNVAFSAPHYPLQEDEAWIDRYAHIADPERRAYAAMVGHMDDAIGRIIRALEERGLRERTLILFLSDNGPERFWANPQGQFDGRYGPYDRLGDASPLRGWKTTVWEGGIRVPSFASLPGRITAGVSTAFTSVADLLPTLVTLAGGAAPRDADGRNLAPLLLEGREIGQTAPFVWLTRNTDEPGVGRRQAAIREGQWKLVETEWRPRWLPSFIRWPWPEVALFDLAEDAEEAQDLAGLRPEIVARLRRALDRFRAETIDGFEG